MRLAGVDLPRNKRAVIGLTYVFGIGKATSSKILKKAGISEDKKINQLTDEEANTIRSIVTSEYKVEGQARGETQIFVKRLMDIGCYRGLRHRRGLPVRGQRTRTNARTRKGKEAFDLGLRNVDVQVKGPGSGRDAAIRTLKLVGLQVKSIRDVTPLPHNGCRPPKRRRV
ncbi:hypothetical protein CHS0354_023752 [Potamilus streckersoni]|uniref:Small ribosomal subunit protein uS13 n=1 Tax=Potamilus streckersoni TaxID=2493646 RepID=A0AAE0RZA5_9BIVA|nr:hypothetical protein CHS0354_023752 [Potamilus streckersoni]